MGIKRISALYCCTFFILLFLLSGKIWAQGGTGGVGLYLDYDPPGSGNLVVYTVVYRSPADKAKVKRGDQLLKVEGQVVKGKSLQEVANLIRGPIGSTVNVTLARGGTPREVPLVRTASKDTGPVVLPPPSQAVASPFLSKQEKALVKQKILGLKTDEQKRRMMQLLLALKNKQISKPKFMRAVKSEFP